MSVEQMTYFYNACISNDALGINNMSIAYGRCVSDMEGQRKLTAQIEKMSSTSIDNLIRMAHGKT